MNSDSLLAGQTDGSQPQRRVSPRRAWRKDASAAFSQVFRPPSFDGGEGSDKALEICEASIGDTLNTIAPLRAVRTQERAVSAPWYSESLKKEKALCTEAEKENGGKPNGQRTNKPFQ